jgi:hypothetical protein
MTTSTPSFLVGVEVTSERESAVYDSTTRGIFPQWETMAGVSGKASQVSPDWFQIYCFHLYPHPSVLSGSKLERLYFAGALRI